MTDLFLHADIVEDKNDQSPFSNIFDFFSEPFHFPGEIGNGSGTLATDIFKPPKPLLAKGFGSLNILKV